MRIVLPKEVVTACHLLAEHHKQAFVVGGGIRDLVLGTTPQDWDLATDARPQEVEEIFTRAGFKVIPTGIRFGTVTVFISGLPVEITTFRLESSYHDFRRPAEVYFVAGIEEDLARRDFTINALAYDPIRDLLKGIIRTVGDPEERFSEDPLRMMRGIRLAAELGFNLEDRTKHGITRCAELICKVSAERIREELSRTLLALHFMKGLQLLLDTGLLFLIIPELKEGWLFSQYHPSHQYPVLGHTLEAMRYTPSSLEVRLAVLLHDIAKPRCFSQGKDGRGHFYGHEKMGARMAEQILMRLRYNTRLNKRVCVLVREHMIDLKMGPAGMRRLIARVGRDLIEELLAVREADFLAHSKDLVLRYLADFEEFRQKLKKIMKEEDTFEMRDLAIDGTDVLAVLECRPGPIVGRILKKLWNEVLDDPSRNTRDYLLPRIREIAEELGWKEDF